jgi:hypothetical protein
MNNYTCTCGCVVLVEKRACIYFLSIDPWVRLSSDDQIS